jgi:anti-sigma B factor antagonist
MTRIAAPPSAFGAGKGAVRALHRRRQGPVVERCDTDALDHDMTITAGETGHASVAVAGDVDASSGDGVRLAILDAARNPGARLEVDLAAGVTFMDSSGLRAIADASRALASLGSGLVLCDVPRRVLRLLAVTDIGADLEVIR